MAPLQTTGYHFFLPFPLLFLLLLLVADAALVFIRSINVLVFGGLRGRFSRRQAKCSVGLVHHTPLIFRSWTLLPRLAPSPLVCSAHRDSNDAHTPGGNNPEAGEQQQRAVRDAGDNTTRLGKVEVKVHKGHHFEQEVKVRQAWHYKSDLRACSA